MPLLENVPAAAAPWGVGERVRGDEGRGGDLTTRAAAVVPREAGCLLHERSEAWRGARAAETHQLHVVLGEVVSPVLPADGELAGHAGGSSGVDAARSKLTSRRGSIRFFSSQEVPADRPRRKQGCHAWQIRVSLPPVHGMHSSSRGKHRKREETARGAARRRIPPRARRPRRISRVDSSSAASSRRPFAHPARASPRLGGVFGRFFSARAACWRQDSSRQKQQRVRRVRLVDHVRASPEHRALPSFVRRHGAC